LIGTTGTSAPLRAHACLRRIHQRRFHGAARIGALRARSWLSANVRVVNDQANGRYVGLE
jgi:hypothetical protein